MLDSENTVNGKSVSESELLECTMIIQSLPHFRITNAKIGHLSTKIAQRPHNLVATVRKYPFESSVGGEPMDGQTNPPDALQLP